MQGLEHRQRGVLAWLCHDRAARQQARDNMPARNKQWVIPGGYGAHHAHGLSVHLDARLIIVLYHLNRQVETRGVADPGQATAHLKHRAKPGKTFQGLTLLATQQRAQLR